MDLLAAWLLYPVALIALCLGLGLLAGWAAGWRLPGVLLIPVGFVTLLALARLMTQETATAPFALVVLLLLAGAGFVVQRAWLRTLRPDPWMLLAAVGIFAIFGAPVILSGNPTFAGYLALGDTSHQLSLADLLAQHGFTFDPVIDGANRRSLIAYVLSGYPVAGQAALGVTAPLGLLDLAWLYQPLLSFMAVVLCLAIGGLVTPILRHRWQVAVAAFVAAQSALVLGFALQGSIKEITTLAALATAVAVLAAAIGERRPPRSLLVLAIAGAAALAALGPAAMAYLAVVAVVALIVWGIRIARARRGADALWLAAAAGLAAVLSLPVLVSLQTQLHVQGGTLTANEDAATGALADLGNLAEPLKLEQALGLWLSGDYRYEPIQHLSLHSAALWLGGICALLGLAWVIRRRAWQPLLLVLVLVAPSIYLLDRGSPYADAKVLTILSPAILLLAILGALALWSGRWRPLSLLLAGALAVAAVSSSALAYHEVSLTPYDRYEELLELNDRLAGRGPVLFTEYDEFGKYFLRDAASYNEPEWPHGFRHEPYNPTALADPLRRPSVKTPLDIDDLRLDYLQSVPYIVMRRSPTTSRPPANFSRVWRGDFYELWQRSQAPRVTRHKPLGPDILHPAATVTAAVAREWARAARAANGRIAYVERAALVGFYVTRNEPPAHWAPFPSFPESLVSSGPARIDGTVEIPRASRYNVWLEGSFARRMTVSIDGEPLATTRPGLNNPGAHILLGTRRLQPGSHEIEIVQGGGDLRPGSGGYRSSLRHIGPMWLQPVDDVDRTVVTIEPGEWRRLVSVRADWLEIVR